MTLVLLLASWTLIGCAPSAPMPVIVEVADARTGEPIEDVVVRASGGTFYVPTMQPSSLGAPGAAYGPPPSPEGEIGRTNRLGQAHMTIAGQRPVYLRFFKTGYPEGYLIVEAGEAQVIGALAWTTGSTSPGIDRTIPMPVNPDNDHAKAIPAMIFRVAASGITTADPFTRD